MAAYRTIEGDTADLIAWRVRGRTAGVAEAILDKNPGLAANGPLLPAGLLVTVPDVPQAEEAQRPLRLWE